MTNPYTQKQQLSKGVYVLEDGNRDWGGELNHNFELLNDALDVKTLTVKQGNTVLGTYNGKQNTEISIPESSGSSENYTLTLKQGNTTLGTFDNSENTEITIPEASGGSVEVTTYTVTMKAPILAIDTAILTGMGYTSSDYDIVAARSGCLKYIGTKTFEDADQNEVTAPCFALVKFLTETGNVFIPYAHRAYKMVFATKDVSCGYGQAWYDNPLAMSYYFPASSVSFGFAGRDTYGLSHPSSWRLADIEANGILDAFAVTGTAQSMADVEIENDEPITVTETLKIGNNTIGPLGFFDVGADN